MPKPKDPMPPPKIDRVAIPDAAALAKSETKLHGLFKDEYAKKAPADRRALANKLLGLADAEMEDVAQRYVMYRDARDIAVELFEAPLAMLKAATRFGDPVELTAADARTIAFDLLELAGRLEPESGSIESVVREMLQARDEHGPTLGKDLTIQQLRDEGRRF